MTLPGKSLLLAGILLATPALAADGNMPFSPDRQIKFLKIQRQIQQLQLHMADLQRQYEQAAGTIKQLQEEQESECTAAAKASNVDLTRYNCDLDELKFVPKPARK
jgi:hypothetical protein